MRSTYRIPATLQAVSQFTASLESDLKQAHLGAASTITLAVQELCVNIVEHAYAGQDGEINITTHLHPDKIILEFEDSAPHHYNPPQHIQPPDPLDLPESGWGIFLVYELMDDVQYQPHSNGNYWRLEKQL